MINKTSEKKTQVKNNVVKSIISSELVDDFRIVAIGASAGGLEALKEFFNNVPDDCVHSFVIIQHLSPDYKSLMAELLAKNTNLPIFEIKNGMQVAKGGIYLIPPKNNMTILNGKLLLTKKPVGQDLNLPIDIFFRSLAEEYGEKSICVILSGTGSDGTRGARAIKEVGGMIMVQDPQQAKFDGMPLSAVNTWLVDYTLPVEQLPAELINFIEHPAANGVTEQQIEKDDETFSRIIHQIRKVTQLDFQYYKRPTLVRRIARRVSVNKLHNLKEYLDFLFENTKEVHILAREFLIGVTKFFRDTGVWEKLSLKIIPDIVNAKKDDQIFKVWCVGSSTGEEAYSMAIIISEELEKQGKNLEVKVFATDLASNHIDIGSRGVYSESIVADVSETRLRKYFVKKGDHYQVVDSLRRKVIFSQHNILRDPPFNKMDIAVCRNLLIYMQPIAQRKIIGLLHYSLKLNGTLLLGSSETLGDYKNVLKEIDRTAKLFKNIKPAKSIGMEPLNYPDYQKLSPALATTKVNAKIETKISEIMSETIAEELGIAGVYIDESYNIVHAIGEFKQFIELPKKGFSINLMKMLPESVSISFGTAVRKAFKSKQRVLYKSLKIKKEKEVILIDLLINPFEISALTHTMGCLLLFMPKEKQEGTAKVMPDLSGVKSMRISELEEELRESSENLQIVIQEVETSNEELQATNEELLAANEELQSTNEELQSVNEELHTVNAELQQKIEDLASLNADMDNYLESTDIGTIFLDRDMRIRKFTPAIREHFNLRDSDIDRPIHHFSNSFGNEIEIQDNALQVIETGETWQTEVLSANNSWFLKRITPYYDSNHAINGAVVSFIDINKIKESEAIIRKSEEKFRVLYESAPDMFATYGPNGIILNCNVRFSENLGYNGSKDLIGKHISDLTFAGENSEKVEERLKNINEVGKLENVETRLKRKDGSLILVSINAEMLRDNEGKNLYTLCSFRDIAEIKETQKKLEDKNKAFEQLLEGTMAGHWDWMIQDGTEYLSPSLKEMFGYEDHEIENSPEAWQRLMHPDDLPGVFDVYNKHVESKGEVAYDNQVRYFHKDGSIVWVYCRGKVIEWDEKDLPIRMVGSHVDITPLKSIEEELYRSNKELEQFAYIASHDLQEPLNTITEFTRLLDEQYKNKLDAEANQYIEFIMQGVHRMSGLVKGVLGYSRVGLNKEVSEIDCNAIIKDVVEDLGVRIKDTDATVKIAELPQIMGYEMEIHSLFLNLLSNAIKFRKKDVKPIIKLTVKEQDMFWHFKVKDNGIGISEKNKNRIFNIFQRLNNMDSYEGTGIGLAQCKKIVEIHGGKLWVESELDKGSTFFFTLKKIING